MNPHNASPALNRSGSTCRTAAACVYRDLKPENFLFKDRADDAELKVIFFFFFSELRALLR